MKVVTIVTQLEAGGAQVAALRLSEGLRAKGHDTETWFLYEKRPTFEGAPEVRVVWPRRPKSPVEFLRLITQLRRELRRLRPDAVVTFTHYANVLGQAAARASGVPVRIASQRNPSFSYPGPIRWLDRTLGRLGWYTDNVAVSHDTRSSFDSYPTAYRRRMTVIHNGLRLSEPGPADPCERAEARRAARRRLGLPEEPRIIVMVGRLARQKNHALLFRALVPLEDTHLALAGEGELRDELEALARELGLGHRIHFLGEIDPAGVKELLCASEVFAMPSRFEGLSNALLEALGAGLPVIASAIPANREVLRPLADAQGHSAAGYLLDPDDIAAWTTGIRNLLDDPGAAAEAGRRARARAEDFSEERMVAAFETLLVHRHGGP